MEIGYVGSQGYHQVGNSGLGGAQAGYSSDPVNMARLASPSQPINGVTTNTVQNAFLRVPYLGFAPTFTPVQGEADFRYNSFQATVRSRVSDLQFQAAYTCSQAEATAFVGNSAARQAGDSPYLKVFGPNPAYRPHRFVANYSWNIRRGVPRGYSARS